MSNLYYDMRMDSSDVSAVPETPSLRAVTKTKNNVSKNVPVINVASSVRDITPYEAVSSQAIVEAHHSPATVFKLDWNESTIGPSPKVNQAIIKHLSQARGLNWYPKLGSTNLLAALEKYTGLNSRYLLASNGSDDALHLICSTFLEQGDEVVIPVPTYNHFMVFVQSRGARIIEARGDNAFAKNLEFIRAKMSSSTRLLYLVSPNNPTGVVYSREDVKSLCEDFPETLIVLDEAYFEFSQISGIELVKEYSNLIVTRTFSKAFGLAGLRVGYLAASPIIIDGLQRIYNPKSLNTLGQIGAVAALNDLDYLNNYLEEVIASKEILREFFESRNVEAQITPANFVVVRMPDIKKTLRQLEALDVYVRDRSSYPGLEGCFRMTVGTIEQTQQLLERLSKVF